MSPEPKDAEDLEQAFLDTADAEQAAFGKAQNARKVALLLAMLAVMLAGGGFVGWAVYAATH